MACCLASRTLMVSSWPCPSATREPLGSLCWELRRECACPTRCRWWTGRPGRCFEVGGAFVSGGEFQGAAEGLLWRVATARWRSGAVHTALHGVAAPVVGRSEGGWTTTAAAPPLRVPSPVTRSEPMSRQRSPDFDTHLGGCLSLREAVFRTGPVCRWRVLAGVRGSRLLELASAHAVPGHLMVSGVVS